jgi:hypothetical protein
LEAIERAFPKIDPTVDNATWQTSVIKVAEDFVRVASGATSSRAFFMSDEGYMGIGPRNVRKEDVVYLFHGCRIPLLIRSEPHVEVEGSRVVVKKPVLMVLRNQFDIALLGNALWGLMNHELITDGAWKSLLFGEMMLLGMLQ